MLVDGYGMDFKIIPDRENVMSKNGSFYGIDHTYSCTNAAQPGAAGLVCPFCSFPLFFSFLLDNGHH